MAEVTRNFGESTLVAPITPSSPSLAIQPGDTGNFPITGNFRVRVDDELIRVTAPSGATFGTLDRGYEGTTAADHAAGADVRHVLTADSLTQLITEGAAGADPQLATLSLMNQDSADALASMAQAVIDFLEAASTSEMRTAIGAVIGTDVQAFSARLSTLAGMSAGSATSLSTLAADVLTMLDQADLNALKTYLGIGAPGGSGDAELDQLALMSSGSAVTLSTLAADVLTFLDAANFAAMRTALGVPATADLNSIFSTNVTDSYTLVAEDAGKAIQMNKNALTGDVPARVTVPANVFTARNVVYVWQMGTTDVDIRPGAGMTLRSSPGRTGIRVLEGQSAWAGIWFRTATEASVNGELAP